MLKIAQQFKLNHNRQQVLCNIIVCQVSTTKTEEKEDKRARVQFKENYYPTKRINFEQNDKFTIFENEAFLKKQWRGIYLKFFGYSYSFLGLYLTNFLFFANFSSLIHYSAMTILAITGTKSLMKETLNYSRLVTQFDIHPSGRDFTITTNLTPFWTNQMLKHFKTYNVKLPLIKQNRVQIQFSVDDIVHIGFCSSIQDHLKNKFKIKSEEEELEEEKQAKNPKETSQDNIEKEYEQKLLRITIQKAHANMDYYIDLSLNNQNNYNDYLVALGLRKNIIMRQSKLSQQKPKQ